MTATIEADRLAEEMQAHLKTARDIADAATKDGERDFTDDERAQIAEALKKATAAKDKIKEKKGDQGLRDAISAIGEGVELEEKSGERRTPAGLIVPDRKNGIGQQFVQSAEYKALIESVPGGRFGEKSRVQSRAVGFKTLITGASDTSAGAFVQNDYRGLQVGLDVFQRPLMLRDVVTKGTTESDTVEFVRMTSTTNAATPVAESTATATPGSPSPATGVKPESALAAAKVTTPVRTIAHWLPMTKRAISDAAQVRTIVDNFLEYGLEEELEDQMISGDNTGENFEGLANVSGVQAQAWDANLLTTTRKAKTKVRTVGRSVPNAYLLNPNDVEAIDLLQDNEARFYFGGPSGVGTAGTLWGLPVVETEAVPAGTGYVGDFRKCILWDREQATITMTDSHSDFFIRNMVAILDEMRAAFGCIQPSAFVEMDLTAA